MQESDYFEMLQDKWYSNWPHPSLPKEPVYIFGEIPIHEYLSKHAAQMPSKDYLIYYGKRITYGEMDELSNKLANYLIENGFMKGDRVALVLPNMPQFYITYFATLKAGGISVLLNPMLKGIELEYFFKESSPKYIVALDLIYPTVKEAARKALGGNVNIILASYSEFLPENPEIPIHPSMKTVGGGIREAKYLIEVISKASPTNPGVKVSIDDNATMNFTGGTTGLPKGVYHKHLDILYTAACSAIYFFAEPLAAEHPDEKVDFMEFFRELSRSEVVLAAMPIFWVAGNNVGVIGPTFAGATIVVLTRWDVKAALEAIHRYRVTTMYAPFDLYWEILDYPDLGKYDLTSLRNCMGSSFIKPLTKDLRYRWKKLTGAVIREAAYGLTETHTSDTFTISLHRNDLDIKRSEKYGGVFCGIPCPGTLIKIVDKNGNILPLGKQGEIAIKSPSLVTGYVGRPEETAKAFKDGWLFTGDIGMYDEDGFFYYISRKKYMLKVSGVSVYPTQIEFIMLKHPAIQLVGVIGVNDPKKGQVPVAFVKLKPEYQGMVTEDELLEWCKKNMAPYNVPRRIIIRDQLPLTTSGKVIREELIKEYEKLTKKMNNLVKVEIIDEHIVKLVLNRPEAMNAINVPMRKKLAEELERMAYNDNIKVVIITGAEKEGKRKAFSSGDDLKEPGFRMESPTVLLDYYKVTDEMMRLYDFIDNYPKPVIAMVNGIALGGGVELALSCDFIFASENAIFGFPEISLGFIPGWGGTQRLTRRVGEANAKRLILTGETINAREAKEIGLVDVVTAEEDLWRTTLDFAKKIAEKSPLMILVAKKSIERGMECSMQSGLLYEMLAMMMSLKTEDMKEGITAFLEKRKPHFTGK